MLNLGLVPQSYWRCLLLKWFPFGFIEFNSFPKSWNCYESIISTRAGHRWMGPKCSGSRQKRTERQSSGDRRAEHSFQVDNVCQSRPTLRSPESLILRTLQFYMSLDYIDIWILSSFILRGLFQIFTLDAQEWDALASELGMQERKTELTERFSTVLPSG